MQSRRRGVLRHFGATAGAGTDRCAISKSMSRLRRARSKGALAARSTFANSTPVFAALGDATRLGLIVALCTAGAMSTAQLTAGTTVSRQAITKHLQVLADAGLVRDIKVGRERLWAFEPRCLEEARRSLEMIGQQWDQALLKLKRAVER